MLCLSILDLVWKHSMAQQLESIFDVFPRFPIKHRCTSINHTSVPVIMSSLGSGKDLKSHWPTHNRARHRRGSVRSLNTEFSVTSRSQSLCSKKIRRFRLSGCISYEINAKQVSEQQRIVWSRFPIRILNVRSIWRLEISRNGSLRESNGQWIKQMTFSFLLKLTIKFTANSRSNRLWSLALYCGKYTALLALTFNFDIAHA